MSRSRPHRWLAALPAALLLFGVPFANRVEPYVLGLPFLLAWIVGCVLLTSVMMAIVRALDGRADRARDARVNDHRADHAREARAHDGRADDVHDVRAHDRREPPR